MARIEFESEISMKELRGFSRFYDGKALGYTTDRLNDDEFNFISGMNYAINHYLNKITENLDDVEELADGAEMLRDLKKQVAKLILSLAIYNCNIEISQLITEFIDSNEVRTKRSAEKGGEAAEWQKEECSPKR